MISVRELTKIYPPDITALERVSFGAKEGEFVSVVGRSGAGKTTLLKLLIAQERPTAGEIFFQEKPVHQMASGELSLLRRNIGVVFQDYKLLSSHTLVENIAYVLEAIGAPKEQIDQDVLEVLELVGLENRARNFPQELSGGELQRAALARAIVHRPRLLLADEPTGNLDPYHTRDMVNLLLKINEMGTSVILATHDNDIVNAVRRRVITLEEGRVVGDEERGKFIL